MCTECLGTFTTLTFLQILSFCCLLLESLSWIIALICCRSHPDLLYTMFVVLCFSALYRQTLLHSVKFLFTPRTSFETQHGAAELLSHLKWLVMRVALGGVVLLLPIIFVLVHQMLSRETNGDKKCILTFYVVVAIWFTSFVSCVWIWCCRKQVSGFPFQPIILAEGDCSICLENFQDNIATVELPCSHRFHESCIRLWFVDHPSCPLCRRYYLFQVA